MQPASAVRQRGSPDAYRNSISQAVDNAGDAVLDQSHVEID
jgi:hypothetical protein